MRSMRSKLRRNACSWDWERDRERAGRTLSSPAHRTRPERDRRLRADDSCPRKRRVLIWVLNSRLLVRPGGTGESSGETKRLLMGLNVTIETCGNGLLIRRFWARIPGGAPRGTWSRHLENGGSLKICGRASYLDHRPRSGLAGHLPRAASRRQDSTVSLSRSL